MGPRELCREAVLSISDFILIPETWGSLLTVSAWYSVTQGLPNCTPFLLMTTSHLTAIPSPHFCMDLSRIPPRSQQGSYVTGFTYCIPLKCLGYSSWSCMVCEPQRALGTKLSLSQAMSLAPALHACAIEHMLSQCLKVRKQKGTWF